MCRPTAVLAPRIGPFPGLASRCRSAENAPALGAIAVSGDLLLAAGVSRTHAGRRLGEVLGDTRITCPIYASAAEALASPCDVFVEYTKPDSAKANVLAAIEHGAHVVVGTSGLTEQDYAEVDVAARRHARGVLGVGNFALTVVLMQRSVPRWRPS